MSNFRDALPDSSVFGRIIFTLRGDRFLFSGVLSRTIASDKVVCVLSKRHYVERKKI